MSIQNIPSSGAAMDAQFARMAGQQAVTPQRAGASDTPPEAAAVNELRSTQRPEKAGNQAAEPDRETLLQAVEDVRKAIEPVAQNLLFSIDDDTGRTIVKVVDAQTDEVIRQMPSEEVLAISKAIDKLKGVLIQQKA
ncbi:flagellar protein FlaG [Thauera phenylacetica]|jgi:flagellar protein FlaG|uniref:Flagellar protein n=1 Tax=Thauera phenylacetica B4P TaxID=1234382 RepID=N6ZTP7_9RHOO|nr:flagellar protein FlaG [Thauera phenylacetica]ENO97728.1 flagellar protein [Thauera phenylacetica B4P]